MIAIFAYLKKKDLLYVSCTYTRWFIMEKLLTGSLGIDKDYVTEEVTIAKRKMGICYS
ncbi:MAG TPA: hypothetical protein VFY41_09040 [Nitrososphaeraceae archaeon]|nr:hypothetical protein [Nitrososphaeraceae archaeon]